MKVYVSVNDYNNPKNIYEYNYLNFICAILIINQPQNAYIIYSAVRCVAFFINLQSQGKVGYYNAHDCNGKNICMRWKMECFIQWGKAGAK